MSVMRIGVLTSGGDTPGMNAAIRAVAQEVLAENPKEVEAFKGGKDTLMGWFVGQVMRKMRGKADPNIARQVLEELLK